MIINKLTITPLQKGFPAIICKKPNTDSASIMIKQRLAAKNQTDKVPRVLKKIPKGLPNWINPDSVVIKNI